ncbi:MAG: carboxylating nicotinate-nucleotide diphosphorylase [Oligoflexales bacterium]
MQDLHYLQIDPLITKALEEDWGYGDWTTDLCVPKARTVHAKIIAKEKVLVSGMEVAARVFHSVDPSLEIKCLVENGQFVESGTELIRIKGAARSVLRAERVALNFLGRMSGISTLARKYVEELKGTKVRLLDTRKTTPGLRILEKSATMVGGARNHRFGLCDGVMVKENHIRSAGGITKAVSLLLESLPPTLKIEVETTNLAEVKEALAAGADIIMLDNMSQAEMREASAFVQGRALLEASGNVRLDNVRQVAECGVDFISTSAVITSARWADLSLLIEE